MFRSLQMKFVLILFVLIFSVMSVLGTFLLNSVTKFYFEEFNKQISSVFSEEVISDLENAAQSDDPMGLKEILEVFSGSLGIDMDRNYYVLNGKTAEYILSSTNDASQVVAITTNISIALNGFVGFENLTSNDHIDFAIPINENEYIIYIIDDKSELDNLIWMIFGITIQAMFLGLIVSIVLSLFLSKTMTNPIENLTKGAIRRAKGDFSKPIEITSKDEIGILTNTFNDMSDILKKTLDKVQEEKNKLSTVFLHMTDGVLAFTKDGSIISMNFKAENMLGIEFDEKLKFKDVFSDIVLPKYEDESSMEYIEIDLLKEKNIYKVLFAPFGNFLESDCGVIVVIHDVTDERRLEDSRKEFVANVSHELRTPLTNIKSYTETILENKQYLDEETEDKFLNIISGETDRMTRIVKDLLTLSKLDYGKMDLTFSKFNIGESLIKVFNSLVLEAANNEIAISKDEVSELGFMNGDRDRIEQVLTNILSNAIKYTQKGGNVYIKAYKTIKDEVIIRVSDNGYGIPKEDLPRIFERFYRVDKARSREKGGTGLGLAIAKNIVEIHGGTIKIDSEVDLGTKVTLTFKSVRSNDYE